MADSALKIRYSKLFTIQKSLILREENVSRILISTSSNLFWK